MVMSNDVSKRQESSRVHVVAFVDDVVMVLLSVCPAGSIKSSQMFEQLTSALVTTCHLLQNSLSNYLTNKICHYLQYGCTG